MTTVKKVVTAKSMATGRLGISNPATQGIPVKKISSGKAPTDKPPSKSDDFPVASVLSKRDMKRVIEIMQDDTEFATQISALEDARKEMKDEIVQIGIRNNVPGLRWGPYVAYLRGMATRRSLSLDKVKRKWVLAGLDVEDLDDCYVESSPFPDVRIVDTSKPKKQTAREDAA